MELQFVQAIQRRGNLVLNFFHMDRLYMNLYLMRNSFNKDLGKLWNTKIE